MNSADVVHHLHGHCHGFLISRTFPRPLSLVWLIYPAEESFFFPPVVPCTQNHVELAVFPPCQPFISLLILWALYPCRLPYPHLHITTPNSAPCQSPMQHPVGQTSQVHSSSAGESVHTTHTYVLKTDYAFVSIKSRAHNIHDIPLMYLQEETTGTIIFPECHLHEVRSIIIVVCGLHNRVYLSLDLISVVANTRF